MHDTTDPTAQGQSAGTESPNQGQSVSPGVQARIDELTARLRETERAAKEKDDQMMALLQTMAVQQPVIPAAQTPQIDIDPEEQRKLDAILGPKFKALEQQLAGFNQFISQTQFQQAAASVPADVQAEANKLYAQWQREGKTGWVPGDAVLVAEAIVMKRKGSTAQTATQQRQEFNQQQQAVSTQTAPASNVQRGIPADIDKRPLAEQIDIYGKELGDIPL